MKPATLVAVLIFAAVALAHLLRLLMGAEVVIAGWTAPLWTSAVGFVVAGALSYFLYRENSA